MQKRVFRQPWIIITVCLALTVFFSLQLGNVEIDNSLRQYFPQQHESYKRFKAMEDDFGSTEMLSIIIQAKSGTILTPEYLEIIGRITGRAEEADFVNEITSLTNVDYIQVEDGSLTAGSLIPAEYTGSTEDIVLIRQKLSDWPDMYNRVIISDDLKSTQMAVTVEETLSSVQKQTVLDNLRGIVREEADNPNLSVLFTGDIVVSENAQKFMLSDLIVLIPLVVLVLLICLFLSFKSLDGTLLPLVTVLMSSIWSVGIMAMLNITFTIVSSVIPVALIAVGSAYGIHVLNHYYIALENVRGELTRERHSEVIMEGLKSVLPAVLLAGITTVAGFVSLVTSPLVPLRSFAVFTALGVVFSLLLATTFIPALLMVKPLKNVGKKTKLFSRKTKAAQDGKDTGGGTVLSEAGTDKNPAETPESQQKKRKSPLFAIYRTLAGTPARLAVTCIAIAVLSVFGIRKLVVETALINYFPADSAMRLDIDFVDKEFAGTNSIYFIVSGNEKGDMTRSEILKPLDDMQGYLTGKYGEIGKVVSFSTFVKRMNQVMHIPEAAEFYETAGEAGFDSFDNTGFSAFGEEDFFYGSFYQEDKSAGYEAFIDPNIEYSRLLSQQLSIGEGLAILNRAYALAGGKNAGIEDIVRELERELNYNGTAYYEIPWEVSKYPAATREELSDLVSQYLLLFSGSLDKFIDDSLQPRTVRMTVQLRTRSSKAIGNIIDDAKEYAAAFFPDGYRIEAAGNAELEYTMTNMIISSQLSSLLFSLISVFIIIAVSFKSPFAGLIGCVPLLFSILLNYMAMGFLGINLDMFTSIIASIAVGVGIDYTIHFMTNYREERAVCDDPEKVIKRTLKKSGRGIVTNAMAVGFGFLVLCFSEFVVLRYIGILAAVVMFTSSLLAMTVLPGILNMLDPKFMRRSKKGRGNRNE
ncbi:MMPL family transporter [Brucepastera parasyntrophica]|uniref:efflux RND transporter permease subunit n=1 Tax=Brucepastera parasyntrophica TaxID=2880008 RepID=UPI00210E2464|nr:MMPL family transporter [Brucepastera parasyntrophica]ULQ60787.1 MMPL family transporter [Brucepastera parasyntrophica]